MILVSLFGIHSWNQALGRILRSTVTTSTTSTVTTDTKVVVADSTLAATTTVSSTDVTPAAAELVTTASLPLPVVSDSVQPSEKSSFSTDSALPAQVAEQGNTPFVTSESLQTLSSLTSESLETTTSEPPLTMAIAPSSSKETRIVTSVTPKLSTIDENKAGFFSTAICKYSSLRLPLASATA